MQAKCAFLITLGGAALAAGSSMMTSALAQTNVSTTKWAKSTSKTRRL